MKKTTSSQRRRRLQRRAEKQAKEDTKTKEDAEIREEMARYNQHLEQVKRKQLMDRVDNMMSDTQSIWDIFFRATDFALHRTTPEIATALGTLLDQRFVSDLRSNMDASTVSSYVFQLFYLFGHEYDDFLPHVFQSARQRFPLVTEKRLRDYIYRLFQIYDQGTIWSMSILTRNIPYRVELLEYLPHWPIPELGAHGYIATVLEKLLRYYNPFSDYPDPSMDGCCIPFNCLIHPGVSMFPFVPLIRVLIRHGLLTSYNQKCMLHKPLEPSGEAWNNVTQSIRDIFAYATILYPDVVSVIMDYTMNPSVMYDPIRIAQHQSSFMFSLNKSGAGIRSIPWPTLSHNPGAVVYPPLFASIVTRTNRNVFCIPNPPHTSAVAVNRSTTAATAGEWAERELRSRGIDPDDAMAFMELYEQKRMGQNAFHSEIRPYANVPRPLSQPYRQLPGRDHWSDLYPQMVALDSRSRSNLLFVPHSLPDTYRRGGAQQLDVENEETEETSLDLVPLSHATQRFLQKINNPNVNK